MRIDSTGALRSLDAILRKINQINGAASRTSNAMSGMSNQLNNGSRAMNNVASQAQRTHSLFSRLQGAAGKIGTMITRIGQGFGNFVPKIGNVVRQHFSWSDILSRIRSGYDRIRSVGQNIGSTVKNWFTNQMSVESSAQRTNGILGSIWQKLKGIAATYLGIMGAKAVIGTADTITSAENKLNYVNGYDVKATQASMDKMYNSAQKVRMSYTDMMSNVSKSMALAGDSFKGNIDNAIRFQEIMAEAYAVGGASAQEMSSSMYQMIQALGSGILAGDELRSVREGAPLAYKAIEKFAQGVYDCNDSLKEMASQGRITSDMVVAGILNAGNELDTAFAQTAQTFAQTWTQIKNVAKKAFEPVARMMRDSLNNAIDNGLIDKVESAFVGIAKVFQVVFKVIANGISWIADNWGWIKNLLIVGLIVLAGYFVYTATMAVISAIATFLSWTLVEQVIFIIIAAILALIYVFLMWKDGAISSCQAVALAIGIIILAIGIAMLLAGNLWGLLVIGAAIAAYFIIAKFSEVCAFLGWLAGWIVNIVFGVVNFIIACVYVILANAWNTIALIVNAVAAAVMAIYTIIQWLVAFVVNLTMGCVNFMATLISNLGATASAVAQNVGIFFANGFYTAASACYDFVADALSYLSKLAPVINGIASLMGKSFNLNSTISNLRGKAASYEGKKQDYVSVGSIWSNNSLGDAWSSGWNTMEFANMGDMVSSGWNTMPFQSVSGAWSSGMGTLTYVDPNAWGSAAGEWGAGVQDWINDKGGNLANKVNDKLGNLVDLDSLGDKLGLNLSDISKDTLFPETGLNSSDPSDLLDDIGKGVDGIGGDTGKIADAMELTEDDLEYLRKIAEMEWKKEYTTAEIKVDMSNYNTINGDSDLDGIVTRLTDKLYEELASVADGVYV